ncbi:hypothetical protein Sta7437_0206 [Stanieria cyanosphaera PCC 7437]|uniref:Uncharacterized protein n=1 Tax=Stanieria cyanosphaera (strain ATCC 29371 / PCC 7437) TaxID=111780 RepID=K9XP12_STAC7|nr:hypothetical protein [Stanieria cyanosphaera]AFZ33824.1 hypothetical protein Sta7437_0206 [Stanieria cyanosphaera PCC 7437]
MNTSIVELVDNLPTDNLTVKVLNALDYIVPGKWENLVGFDNTISAITGETKNKKIAKIRDRAIDLYNDKQQGYQTAIWLYRTVDATDKAVAAAALADKIGDAFRFIPFLDKLTPKADLVQSVDLRIKLVAELIAYSKLNGITLNPSKFVASVRENYQKEALMRMVALVCIDGVLPLGTNFVPKVRNDLENRDNLAQDPAFNAVSQFIPTSDKRSFINESFNTTGDWMTNLISSAGITRESLANRMRGFVNVADDKLDYLAAFLDGATNYFEHTGIQTVARTLINRAYREVN